MKVLVTGATGFIGREVLDKCLQNPSVTSVVALTRRPLQPPPKDESKLKVVVVDDFATYPPAVLQETAGSDACIWALGKAWMPDNDLARKIHVDYPLAAAKALASQAGESSKKVRFVLLSGGAAERDQSKGLWFMQDYRKIRGLGETELLTYTESNPDHLESYVFKPGMVLAKEGSLRDTVRSLGPSIKVENLADALIKTAIAGSSTVTLENPAIRAMAG